MTKWNKKIDIKKKYWFTFDNTVFNSYKHESISVEDVLTRGILKKVSPDQKTFFYESYGFTITKENKFEVVWSFEPNAKNPILHSKNWKNRIKKAGWKNHREYKKAKKRENLIQRDG